MGDCIICSVICQTEAELKTLKSKLETLEMELNTKIKKFEDKQDEVQQLQDQIQRTETILQTEEVHYSTELKVSEYPNIYRDIWYQCQCSDIQQHSSSSCVEHSDLKPEGVTVGDRTDPNATLRVRKEVY
ncbi:testis-expressed protein 9-like [Micropterus salmoides]|uniref:testis-expressed protein 9-like n=1 Tax=Micropterus salmoides TaxID=27706 RepID=UPI0018EB8E98|nr:testis-expressed protein 9-like [Micropterus salmoides]